MFEAHTFTNLPNTKVQKIVYSVQEDAVAGCETSIRVNTMNQKQSLFGKKVWKMLTTKITSYSEGQILKAKRDR